MHIDQTPTSEFFVAGGTLKPNVRSYVERSADQELFQSTLAREFCYVLTPRQMGKSSLMVRTAKRLQEQGVHTAIIDLTGIGTVSVDKWYLGLLTELARAFRLSFDPEQWWRTDVALGQPQRFIKFLRDVVLAEVTGQLVVFIDEIDYMLKLNFRDDFFAAIRAMYNSRSRDVEFERLTFVLLGVASPTDLIEDRSRTPFNIGCEIALQELQRKDAGILLHGLSQVHPQQPKIILDRIFYWTSGHPYLTQRLCLTIKKAAQTSWSNEQIDELVEKMFLSDGARGETNIQFVNDKILSYHQRQDLLRLYRQVLLRKTIPDNKQSLLQSQLKLSGLVKVENGKLQVRNEIYRRAFNTRWVRKHVPVNWTATLTIVMLGIMFVSLVSIFSIFYINTITQPDQAEILANQFDNTDEPQHRAYLLIELFKLQPIVVGPNYENRALDLFFGLNFLNEQIAILQSEELDNQDRVLLVQKIYVTLADIDSTNSNILLLETMYNALHNFSDVEAANLNSEINSWLNARKAIYEFDNYTQALQAYTEAIEKNPDNPSTLFERAKVNIQLGNFESALADLNSLMAIAAQKEVDSTNPQQIPTTLHLIPTPLLNGSQISPSSTIAMTPSIEILQSFTVSAPEVTFQPAIQSQFVSRGEITRSVIQLISNNLQLANELVDADTGDFQNLRQDDLIPHPATLQAQARALVTATFQGEAISCGPPTSWVVYQIQSGDTLNSLATKTGTTIEQIMQANCFASATLLAGSRIYLPSIPLLAQGITSSETNAFAQPDAYNFVMVVQANQEVNAILQDRNSKWVQVYLPDREQPVWILMEAVNWQNNPQELVPTITPSPTPKPEITGIVREFLRVWPEPSEPILGFGSLTSLNPGQIITAVARDTDGEWLKIRLDGYPEGGWIKAQFINLRGDINDLPLQIPSGD